MPAPSLAALPNADQLTARHRDPSKTRILMLGDSQMFTLLFYGNAEFSAAGPQFSYAPIIGCGIFDAAEHLGGNCEDRAQIWKTQIQKFDPDLSVLLIGAWETLDFTVNGHLYVHGTEAHERELEELLRVAIAPLTARRGRVALLEVPCFDETQGDNPQVDAQRNSPESIANVNDAMKAVASAEPDRVSFVRWASAICPGGHYVAKIDGVTVRPDGVHYGSKPAGKIVTDRLVPILSRLALEARAAREDRAEG